MFNLNLRYLLSVCALFFVCILFFLSEFLIPHLKKWKSNKLLNLSKVYHDESISTESDLLAEGVRKARIASLLDPNNDSTRENFLSLLFRFKPSQALQKWSQIANSNKTNDEERAILLKRSISTLKNDLLMTTERKIAGEIAIEQLNELLKNNTWLDSPDNSLIASELFAETGDTNRAYKLTENSIENHPAHAESLFLFSRLTVHLNRKDKLPLLGSRLAKLATRKGKTGVDAIRHMTLLHLLNPLSESSLKKCLELLRSNTKSEPIDFMRIYALQYESAEEIKKKQIIESCADQFDLEQNKELMIFARWLGRLGAFEQMTEYISANRAKVEEELFKLRMNALAQIKDLESIHFEVNNAPIIPERWRLVIESRAFAMEGNYKEAIRVLNRLLPVLGNDPRLVRSVCEYLEKSNDVKSLTHVLSKLALQPIHESFALKKLMQFQSKSASLEELLGWMSKLSKLHGKDPFFSQSYLYFELLDPFLATPSRKLSSLLEEAKTNLLSEPSAQNRISLALAELRNESPDKALVALGNLKNWRNWQQTRPAWSFIASMVFHLNHDSEKSIIIRKSIDFENIDRAEKESLVSLFPNKFPNSE